MLDTLREKIASAIYPKTNASEITPIGGEFPSHSGYDDYRIDAEKLLSVSESGVVDRLLWQIWMLIEHGRDFKIVTPEDQTNNDALVQKVQEVKKQLWRIDTQLDTGIIMSKLWADDVIFGSGLVEMGLPVDDQGQTSGWGDIDGWNAPEWLQYLDAYSFADQYQGCNEPAFVLGRMLKGIVWERSTKQMQYWQVPYLGASAIQIPVGRILHIKDKRSRYPDGKSYLAGIAPTVSQLEYVRKAFMQNVATRGVQRLALQVKEMRDPAGKPLPPPDGKAGKTRFERAYKVGENAVKNYGNNQATLLWEDHEPIWAPAGNLGDIIKPDEYLKAEILNQLMPRDWIEQTGQAISTTSQPLLELAMMVVHAWREIISKPFEDLYTQILEANGFTDWACEFTYTDPNMTALIDKQKVTILAYQAGMLAPERAYKEMEWDAPTDEEKAFLENKAATAATKPVPSQFGNLAPVTNELKANANVDNTKKNVKSTYQYPQDRLDYEDAQSKKLSASFLDSVKEAIDKTQWAVIAGLIASKTSTTKILEAIQVAQYDPLPELTLTYKVATNLAAKYIGNKLNVLVRLDLLSDNPEAAKWLKDYGASEVAYIDESQREAIRSILSQGYKENLSYEAQANYIKQFIGLDPNRAGQLQNYATELYSQDLKDSEVWKLLESRGQELLKERADVIALNETLQASKQGFYDTTSRLVDEGILNPDEYVGVWTATIDDRTCMECMDANGSTRQLPDGTYDANGDTVPGLHVGDRCVETIERI